MPAFRPVLKYAMSKLWSIPTQTVRRCRNTLTTLCLYHHIESISVYIERTSEKQEWKPRLPLHLRWVQATPFVQLQRGHKVTRHCLNRWSLFNFWHTGWYYSDLVEIENHSARAEWWMHTMEGVTLSQWKLGRRSRKWCMQEELPQLVGNSFLWTPSYALSIMTLREYSNDVSKSSVRQSWRKALPLCPLWGICLQNQNTKQK